MGPGRVQLQSTTLRRCPDASAEFGTAAAVQAHEGVVDQLDVDTAILYRLDAVGDLDELTSGGFRVGWQRTSWQSWIR